MFWPEQVRCSLSCDAAWMTRSQWMLERPSMGRRAFQASLPLLISSSIQSFVSRASSSENVELPVMRPLPSFLRFRECATPAQKFIPWKKGFPESKIDAEVPGPEFHYKRPGMESPFVRPHKSQGKTLAESRFSLWSVQRPAGPWDRMARTQEV